MRKLFWCSVAVAVATAGGVYLASKSVENSPCLVLGKALVTLGGEAGCCPGDGVPEGVIPEPTPVNEGSLPQVIEEPAAEVVAVADPSAPGHILIEEDVTQPNRTPEAAVSLAPQAFSGPVVAPAPALMPYCIEGDEAGPRQMPYAEEEECEASAYGADGEVWGRLRKVAREAVSESMPEAGEEEACEPDETECPEDNCEDHRYEHPPVCPYTGRSSPEYRTCPPAPEAPEEKKDENKKKGSQRSESRKVSPPQLDEDLVGVEEQDMPHLRLDTMEFRPSDAGYQPLLPRPF